jgi:chromosome segregation ATPase
MITVSPKRVTVDQLATMVGNGFLALQEEMREGFRLVRMQLGEHGERLDAIEIELKDHSARFDRIDAELRDHSARFDRIERKLDTTIERVEDHGIRLRRLEHPRGS